MGRMQQRMTLMRRKMKSWKLKKEDCRVAFREELGWMEVRRP